MLEKTPENKIPPKEKNPSLQLDLFSTFVSNNESEVSNTIEMWESIPKYFFSPNKVKKLLPKEGQPSPYEMTYMDRGSKVTVVIQPALIKENGVYKAYFPSTTEELIEEVLKKIFSSHGSCSFHDSRQAETWVKFTLRMLQKELKKKGRTRDLKQIKRSIEVMSKCHIAYCLDDSEVWSGSILQDLVSVTRNEYLKDRDSHHICRLPLFISHAINGLDYRQFNYDRLMHCKSALARWIYKRVVNRYIQANFMNNYHFMYSDLKNSGLLQQGSESDNRKKVIAAIRELTGSVFMKSEIDERREGRKIMDIKYVVYPSSEFISEQKAANKRASDSRKSIERHNATCG